MSKPITRQSGDQSPVRWFADSETGLTKDQPDWSRVTAATLHVYTDKTKATTAFTMVGDKINFDSAITFPYTDVNDAVWSDEYYWEVSYVEDGLTKYIPGLNKWVQA